MIISKGMHGKKWRDKIEIYSHCDMGPLRPFNFIQNILIEFYLTGCKISDFLFFLVYLPCKIEDVLSVFSVCIWSAHFSPGFGEVGFYSSKISRHQRYQAIKICTWTLITTTRFRLKIYYFFIFWPLMKC